MSCRGFHSEVIFIHNNLFGPTKAYRYKRFSLLGEFVIERFPLLGEFVIERFPLLGEFVIERFPLLGEFVIERFHYSCQPLSMILWDRIEQLTLQDMHSLLL